MISAFRTDFQRNELLGRPMSLLTDFIRNEGSLDILGSHK